MLSIGLIVMVLGTYKNLTTFNTYPQMPQPPPPPVLMKNLPEG